MAKPSNTEQFFHDVGQRYDSIVIAERHYAPGNEKIYNDPGFYKGLGSSGFSHIAVELPPELQPAIDAYYNNDHEYFGVESGTVLKPENLHADLAGFNFKGRNYTHVEVAQTLAHQIEGARVNGMSVMAMDDRDLSRSEQDQNFDANYVKDLLEGKNINEAALRENLGLQDASDVSPYDFLAVSPHELSAYATNEEMQAFDNAKAEHAQAVRMQVDENWHEHLTEHLPEGSKVVAVVGSSHPANIIKGDGLDERLGGDEKVATIQIAQNPEALAAQAEKMSAYSQGGLQAPTDDPHAVIYTDSMSIEVGDKLDVEGYDQDTTIEMESQGNNTEIESAPAMQLESATPAP